MRIMSSWGWRALVLATVVLTIGCDRVTKRVAAESLAGAQPRSYLANTVRLEYAENTGGFLSLGENLPAGARTNLFTIGTGVLLLVVAGAAFALRADPRAFTGFSLVLAGGASNLADRLVHGRVVDFLNVGVGPLRTGIFNVADAAITIGVLLLLIPWRRSSIFASL